jgi:hypothetical protein
LDLEDGVKEIIPSTCTAFCQVLLCLVLHLILEKHSEEGMMMMMMMMMKIPILENILKLREFINNSRSHSYKGQKPNTFNL